jgi:hypothetical protein
MAAITLADLLNPLIKLEKSFAAQTKKLDELVKAIAIGNGGKNIKSLDKDILKELKTQTKLLEQIATKSGDPLTAVKAGIAKAKGEVEKLTEGGKALSALGIGAKDLGIGLMILTLVPAKVMTKFTDFVVGIASAFDQVDVKKLQKGGEAINTMGDAVWNFTKKIAFSSLLILPFIPVLPILMLAVYGVGLVVAKIGQMKGIKQGSKALKDIGSGLIGFGVGITALAIASLIIIAKPMTLPVMFLTLVLIGGAIALLGLVAGPLKQGSKALKDTGIGLASFAIGVGVFALVATFIPWETIPKMGAILLVVGGVLAIIGAFAEYIKKGSIALAIAGGALIALSVGLLVFNYAVSTLGAGGLLMMTGVLIGIAVVFGAAGAALPEMMAGALALAMAGVALIALGVGLLAFNYAVSTIGSMEDVGKMALAIGGISLVFAAAGLASYLILPGAIALAVAGVALILLSIGVAVFSLVWSMDSTKDLFANSGQKGILGGPMSNFEVAITSIAYGMAINPITAGFIIIGSAALIVASVALMLTSLGVTMFGKMYAKEEGKGKGSIFADRPGYEVGGLFGIGTRPGSNLEFAVESIARSFMLNPVQVAAMYSTAPALIMAGFALSSIADGVSDFVKVIDKITDKDGLEGVANKISTTLTVISQAFGAIGADSSPLGRLGGSLLAGMGINVPGTDKYSPDEVKAGIAATRGMGDILVNVAKGVAAFATMRYVDSKGKEVKIDSDQQAKAIANITSVMTTIPQAFGSIGSSTTSLGRLASKLIEGATGVSIPTTGEYSAEEVKSGIESVAGMGDVLVGLAAGIAAFANGTYKDSDGKTHQIDYAAFAEGGASFIAIKGILTSIPGVFGSIGKTASLKDKAGNFIFGGDGSTAEEVKRGIDAVQGMGGILSGIAEFLKVFAESKGEADPVKIKDFLSGIITAVTELATANAETESGGVKLLQDLFNALAKAEDMADPLAKVAVSVDKIKTSINAIKLDNLKSTVELMQNINDLKETDAADGLKSIAESIQAVIESLKPKEAAATTAAAPASLPPGVQGTQKASPAAKPATGSPQDMSQTLAKLQATLSQINVTLSNLPADIAAIEIKMPKD